MDNFNATVVKEDIVRCIRKWFEENGKDCKAVIGISGGKDSSVVAALCCEALGKDRVIGVLMPNGEQSDIDDAKALVNHLGIQHYCINIKSAFDDILARLHYSQINVSDQTRFNLPPRLRMSVLYAVSQSVGGRVIGTGNRSENFVGYFTRWGDGVSDFEPLAMLLTDEVIAVGLACGLPVELVLKTPADGLTGKTDEDMLGFSYDDLNRYIRNGTSGSIETDKKIAEKHYKNSFKQFLPSFYMPEPLCPDTD